MSGHVASRDHLSSVAPTSIDGSDPEHPSALHPARRPIATRRASVASRKQTVDTTAAMLDTPILRPCGLRYSDDRDPDLPSDSEPIPPLSVVLARTPFRWNTGHSDPDWNEDHSRARSRSQRLSPPPEPEHRGLAHLKNLQLRWRAADEADESVRRRSRTPAEVQAAIADEMRWKHTVRDANGSEQLMLDRAAERRANHCPQDRVRSMREALWDYRFSMYKWHGSCPEIEFKYCVTLDPGVIYDREWIDMKAEKTHCVGAQIRATLERRRAAARAVTSVVVVD